MGLLKVIEDAPGYVKATFQGPQGSGKTFTMTKLACRIHKVFGSTKPIAMFDTETGSDYVAHLIEEQTGKKPLRIKSRGFAELGEVGAECVAGASDIFWVDSITHIWREIQSAHMEAVNEDRVRRNWDPKTRMDIQDIMRIKERWQVWPDFFLNAPIHILVAGREGAEWGNEENEETGKHDLIQVGKKMKVEAEFGYEASLQVSMSIRQNAGGWSSKGKGADKTRELKPRELIQVATILKDRFDVLNGQMFEMPEGDIFDPFLKLLHPELHKAVKVTTTTQFASDPSGYDKSRRDREIVVEKILGEFERCIGGTGGEAKKARLDVMESLWNTRSWTEATERRSLIDLNRGLAVLTKWMTGVATALADGIKLDLAIEGAKKAAFEAASAPAVQFPGDDDVPTRNGTADAPKADPATNGQAAKPVAPKAELFRLVTKWSGLAVDDIRGACILVAQRNGFKGVDRLKDEQYTKLIEHVKQQMADGVDWMEYTAAAEPAKA